MTRPILTAILLASCAGQAGPELTANPDRGRLFVPPPTERQHVAGYLGLRHRLTGESPWVLICEPVTIPDVPGLDADLRTVQSVRSIMAVPREACEPPDEARANPSIGALLIEAIVRTDTSVTLWARRVRGVWPFSWHEEFRFYDMDERLMLSQFSAID